MKKKQPIPKHLHPYLARAIARVVASGILAERAKNRLTILSLQDFEREYALPKGSTARAFVDLVKNLGKVRPPRKPTFVAMLHTAFGVKR